jgi:hypothetical protein
MHSGKIAVPPGGGGFFFIIIHEYIKNVHRYLVRKRDVMEYGNRVS